MNATYTQCRLRASDGEVDTRWIPTVFAIVGRKFVIKSTGKRWTVEERGQTWPEKRVLDYERDYVTMPTVTDAFPDGHGGRRLPVRPR